MHEVAESRPSTFAHLVLTATGLPEVSHGRQFGINGSSIEPSVVEIIHCLLCILFISKLDVDIAHEMVSKVVAYVHLLNLSILVLQLNKDILEKVVKVFLNRSLRDNRKTRNLTDSPVWIGCDVGWVLVEVREQDCLRECGLVMDPRTSVSVTTGSDLEVKGTVYPEKTIIGLEWIGINCLIIHFIIKVILITFIGILTCPSRFQRWRPDTRPWMMEDYLDDYLY